MQNHKSTEIIYGAFRLCCKNAATDLIAVINSEYFFLITLIQQLLFFPAQLNLFPSLNIYSNHNSLLFRSLVLSTCRDKTARVSFQFALFMEKKRAAPLVTQLNGAPGSCCCCCCCRRRCCASVSPSGRVCFQHRLLSQR